MAGSRVEAEEGSLGEEAEEGLGVSIAQETHASSVVAQATGLRTAREKVRTCVTVCKQWINL